MNTCTPNTCTLFASNPCPNRGPSYLSVRFNYVVFHLFLQFAVSLRKRLLTCLDIKVGLVGLGVSIPLFAVDFNQRKAGLK